MPGSPPRIREASSERPWGLEIHRHSSVPSLWFRRCLCRSLTAGQGCRYAQTINREEDGLSTRRKVPNMKGTVSVILVFLAMNAPAAEDAGCATGDLARVQG